MIGRHQLILQPFYPFLLRYLQSHEKDKIGEIFAMIIESCHDMVPPEEIKPIVEKIISNFITEYCNNKHITIGLNAIREILTRMPLALDEAQIEYLVAFRKFRNSSVVNATKSLINYFRDMCPHMLPKKFRGRFTKDDGDNRKEDFVYGRSKLSYDIDGIELLAKHLGYEDGKSLSMSKVLTDEDFKTIKKLKFKEALKHVIKDKRTIKKEEEEENKGKEEEEDSQEYESGEEIEDDDEEGEIDLDGEIDGSNDLQDDSDIEDDDEEGEDEDDEEENEDEQEEDDSQSEEEEPSKNLSDIGSSQLEVDSDDEPDNPHGFVYARNLDTFKKSKREKIEIQMKEREDTKDERKAQFKKRDKKKGGKTNKQNVKNKPFNMVKPKKLESIAERFQSTKSKLTRLRVQLGKFKKTQKSKIENRRKQFRQA